ncbi:hypothetical protein PLESTB_000157100 [Pleodorina starrii]|uniref:Uncharacterized protein n=1 Tax=Pleodorina starrii TaxID=330485 RepID=A0A9W6EXM8_9CHLO|nr:hypothetical protein PLESTM_000455600 [Pleodorina starrii]GLC48867.1 hypothetical protein PLESTB_000157100 [Pleodorina starrii]GLC72596.1 hypothetical protein PLESTF_001268500 [Pleodorina starrii]
MCPPNRTLQTSGQRLRSGTAAPLHSGGHRSRALVDVSRSSRRPEASRPAVGRSSFPLTEQRNGLGVGSGTLTSTSTTTSRVSGGAVGSHAWLPACVRHIVTAVGQRGRGPMLQLVFSRHSSGGIAQHCFETASVSQSLADNPARWSEFSEHVRSSGANGLVLVRPIASPDQHCIYAAAATTTQGQTSPPQPTAATCTSCTEEACSPSDAASRASTPQSEVEVITGQVGACCGSGNAGRDGRPATSTSAEQPQQAAARAPKTAALAAALPLLGRDTQGDDSPCVDGPTQYFGLVVQGSDPSEADGCWVLKTTRSDFGGAPGLCSCTHFSLTRVCLGQPLYAQLRDAWLVR